MPLHLQCDFRFQDSATAAAALTVVGPEDFNLVDYSGELHRLSDRPARASSVGIVLWAEDTALDLGCQLAVTRSGSFDAWAL